MAQTLWGETTSELGPKAVQAVTSWSLRWVYMMARDADDPEREPSPDERLEAVLEKMATRPHLRPLLRRWRLRFDALFARLLDGEDPLPQTDRSLIEYAANCSREHGEAMAAVLERAQQAETGEAWSEALSEVMQAQEAIHQLGRAIERHMQRQQSRVAARRIGNGKH